jgi:hypothetical protein
MPLYLFESKDGRAHEEWFSVDERPELGATIVRDGVRYTRVLSTRVVATSENDGYHVARSLPRWNRASGEPCPYPRVNERGQGVFVNNREIREFSARSGGKYKYDPD